MFDKKQIPTTINKELYDKVVDSLVDTDKMIDFSKQPDEELDRFCVRDFFGHQGTNIDPNDGYKFQRLFKE